MASATPRWGYTTAVLAVAVALGVWSLDRAGWLSGWDAAFYDRLLAPATGWRHTVPKILTVHLDREADLSPVEQFQLLNSLHDLGARAIVFSFVPRASPAFFQRAAELRTVVFGRRLSPDPQDPDKLALAPWPEAARGIDLNWGVVRAPPALKGIYRSALAFVPAGTNIFPSLATRTASLAEPVGGLFETNRPFRVSFVGPPGSIPAVEASRVLAGDLVPPLVHAKIVLVGVGSDLLELETPVSTGNQTMSLLEFEANTLQTVLDGTAVRVVGPVGCLCLLLSLGLIGAFLYQRINFAGGLRLAFALVLVCALVAFVTLAVFRIWLPLGALVLAQATLYGLALASKTRLTNRAVNELRLHLLGELKDRPCPDNFLLSPAYWDQLVAFVNQTLDADRMLFLAKSPRSQRLREAKAVNCSPADVKEKERSLDAEVFAPPLQAQAPVMVSGFFKPREAEEQYLCPLVFSGEVLGVWALGIQAAKTSAQPEFPKVLAELTERLSLLLHSRARLGPPPTLVSRLNAWFSTGKERRACDELKRATSQLEQYCDVLEILLSRVSTGVLVYDLFGRLLYANEPANTLLRAENCPAARLSARETLRQLTGTDETKARSLLSRVLLESSALSLPIKLASQGDRQFLLRIYPLSERPATSFAKTTEPGSSAAGATEAGGIVFELIDTTQFSNLASLRSVVAERLGVELRDHLAAVEVSAALLETDSLSRDERAAVLTAIHHKTASCVHVLAECRKYLGREFDSCKIDCYPLDALELLAQSCADLAGLASERRVTYNIEHPRLMDHVLASKTELAKLFSTAIELLLRDAAENTSLTIVVENEVDVAVFRFANSGFGIPDERLQQILSSSAPPAGEEFQVFREALAWVRDWDGALAITSGVGAGYKLSLTLRHFRLASLAATESWPAQLTISAPEPESVPKQVTAPEMTASKP